MPQDSTAEKLPIFEIRDALVEACGGVEPRRRIVVEAPTGSGKSTQVPQILLDSGCLGNGEILVLQPRRIAARMLARRVAAERGERVGGKVGYQVRFESAVSGETRIRFITEGILIRRILDDPALPGVAAVIFDEFHERHFFGDISLARCLEVQENERPDLRLVVMSATLEIEPLKTFLGPGCRHLRSEGRTFPVEVRYAPPKERHRDDLWDLVTRALRDHFRGHPAEGHCLVFLPGRHEIRKTVAALRRAPWSGGFEIVELYGDLAPEKQDAATAPSSRPKIVVATNVAETSITIDGVRLVVDSGLERRSSFDSRRGITTLHIEKISRASADQRAGRAGRTGPGQVIRLWSESDQARRAESTPPEIFRMDLAEALLLLVASGVRDLEGFRWFDRPDAAELARATDQLERLGAIDSEGGLTAVGREMSRLPVAPRYGRILVEAGERGCLDYVSLIAAAVQARPFFLDPSGGREGPDRRDYAEVGDVSDFQALVRAWERARQNRFDREACAALGVHGAAGREIERIARQLRAVAGRAFPGADQDRVPDGEELADILLVGLSDRMAIRSSAATLSCRVVESRRGTVEKTSLAARREGPFVAAEMVEVEGRDVQVKLDYATAVDDQVLARRFPADFSESDGGVYNEKTRRVEGRRERRFRDLVIESRAGGEVPDEVAARLLGERILSGELILKRWDGSVEEFIARVNLLAVAFPEYEMVPIDGEARQLIVEQVCEGARGYKEIKDRPVMPSLRDWLPPEHRGLVDRLAPERVSLQGGRSVRVRYADGEKPKIAVMIQHLFGIQATPTIGDGRIPLVVEILAPNQRPVQVTEDLAGFWKGSYAGVRAQLRGRYPKHDWPEPGG